MRVPHSLYPPLVVECDQCLRRGFPGQLAMCDIFALCKFIISILIFRQYFQSFPRFEMSQNTRCYCTRYHNRIPTPLAHLHSISPPDDNSISVHPRNKKRRTPLFSLSSCFPAAGPARSEPSPPIRVASPSIILKQRKGNSVARRASAK